MDRLSPQPKTGDRLAKPQIEEESPNILTRFIRSVAKPAIQTGLTGFRVGQGIAGLATGKPELVRKGISKEEVDFGYLGKVAPVKTTGEAISTGAQVGLDIATSRLAPPGVAAGFTKLGEKIAQKTSQKLLSKVVEIVGPRLTPKKAA